MLYPALDVRDADPELVLAVVDDFSPSAVEEHADRLTIYFPTSDDRDRAERALVAAFPGARTTPREVDDEDWARRSQADLQPIVVGDITILPKLSAISSQRSAPDADPSALHARPDRLRQGYGGPPKLYAKAEGRAYALTIVPSMGFGTGHHQTTRLCLAAMQRGDVKAAIRGGNVLDVGTGSGILALAAKLFGAARVTGIDVDADAIHSARENLDLNGALESVAFEIADLRGWLGGGADRARAAADVVIANLTGALLAKSAGLLAGGLRPGGHLIASGLLKSEELLVTEAFVERTRVVSITSEDEWVCLVLKKA